MSKTPLRLLALLRDELGGRPGPRPIATRSAREGRTRGPCRDTPQADDVRRSRAPICPSRRRRGTTCSAGRRAPSLHATMVHLQRVDLA